MAMLIHNCRKLTLFSAQLFRPTSVASQIVVRHTSSYESKRFPGYSVIYSLDTIKTVSIVNHLKRNSSVLAGIITSGSCGLELLNILPFSIASTVVYAGLSVALFLHGIGIYCNNVIGYIYVKKGTEELVVSYVNYWGKRIDLQTTSSTVNCFESPATFYMPFFNILKIDKPKVTLKMLSKGKIIDDKEFYNIFGFQ